MHWIWTLWLHVCCTFFIHVKDWIVYLDDPDYLPRLHDQECLSLTTPVEMKITTRSLPPVSVAGWESPPLLTLLCFVRLSVQWSALVYHGTVWVSSGSDSGVPPDLTCQHTLSDTQLWTRQQYTVILLSTNKLLKHLILLWFYKKILFYLQIRIFLSYTHFTHS